MIEKHMDKSLVDQYVLALVGMGHADAEMMPDSSVRGKTWLQKMFYMASKQIDGNLFEFVPHQYDMHFQALEGLEPYSTLIQTKVVMPSKIPLIS